METIKSYTDIQQSKKLEEILPLESADMRYEKVCFDRPSEKCWYIKLNPPFKSDDIIPCWSLTALLSVLPDGTDIIKDKADTENEKYMCTVGVKDDIISTFGNNPIDACYKLVIKLHKLKSL